RRLRVFHARLHDAYVVRNVSIRGKDVGQAIEIVVEKEAGKRQRLGRDFTDTGRGRVVREQTRTVVVVERDTLVGEVSDDDALPARAVVITRIDTHPGARRACFAERHAGDHGVVGEGAVVVVAVELVWFGVVGDEEIHPTVVIVIEQCDAQSFACGIV